MKIAANAMREYASVPATPEYGAPMELGKFFGDLLLQILRSYGAGRRRYANAIVNGSFPGIVVFIGTTLADPVRWTAFVPCAGIVHDGYRQSLLFCFHCRPGDRKMQSLSRWLRQPYVATGIRRYRC